MAALHWTPLRRGRRRLPSVHQGWKQLVNLTSTMTHGIVTRLEEPIRCGALGFPFQRCQSRTALCTFRVLCSSLSVSRA
eukprot:2430025-Amphidinium_carterae.2